MASIAEHFPSATENKNTHIKSLIHECRKNTESTWDDIEPDSEKEFMIIKISPGSKVRGRDRTEVTGEVKNNGFPIVGGIDYNSGAASNALIYMEV